MLNFASTALAENKAPTTVRIKNKYMSCRGLDLKPCFKGANLRLKKETNTHMAINRAEALKPKGRQKQNNTGKK